jgi:hypothetical protein
MLTTQQIKEIILKELPAILEEDPEIHRFFLQLSQRHFADKIQTEDRFDRVIDELRHDREEQNRKRKMSNFNGGNSAGVFLNATRKYQGVGS